MLVEVTCSIITRVLTRAAGAMRALISLNSPLNYLLVANTSQVLSTLTNFLPESSNHLFLYNRRDLLKNSFIPSVLSNFLGERLSQR